MWHSIKAFFGGMASEFIDGLSEALTLAADAILAALLLVALLTWAVCHWVYKGRIRTLQFNLKIAEGSLEAREDRRLAEIDRRLLAEERLLVREERLRLLEAERHAPSDAYRGKDWSEEPRS